MIKNIPELLEKIYEEIRKNCDVGVVGCSGGADSSLVATLCSQALGVQNVYGVSMPYGITDKETFNARSKKTAEKLGINHLYIPIGFIADDICESVTEGLGLVSSLNKINKANARARARMCVLYGVAHELEFNFKKRVRVVDTCNLSETFIGFFTKFGDGASDFNPIGELFKSEVYQLLDYFINESILSEENVDRVPSAGFGWTDEEELGHDYNSMEKVIRWYLYCQKIDDLDEWHKFNKAAKVEGSIEKFVMDRHFANKHKLEAPPVFELRKYIEE